MPTRFSPTGIGGTHLNSANRIVIDEVDNIKRLIKMAGGDVSRFHQGGIVNGDSSSPSNLTKLVNKLFNTSGNEQLIKALKNELYVPQVNLTKFFVPNMSKLISGLTPQLAVSGGGDTVYNLNFHVDKIENNDKGADYIFKKINNRLSKLGK